MTSGGAEERHNEECQNREYVGDGVYFVCLRDKGHDGGHDYGWGIGQLPRTLR